MAGPIVKVYGGITFYLESTEKVEAYLKDIDRRWEALRREYPESNDPLAKKLRFRYAKTLSELDLFPETDFRRPGAGGRKLNSGHPPAKPPVIRNKTAKNVGIPIMSISHSDLMSIRSERSDAGLFHCETVIDIRQEISHLSW